MCGRARCSLSREEAAKKADLAEESWKDIEKYEPKYNMQPGSSALVAVKKDGEGKRTIQAMTWGLVPSWTKDSETKLDFFRMFNARSETVPEKSVFNRLLSSKRCVVLLNGFYDWAQEHKTKQPYYIHYTDERVMAMAGLYDNWRDAEGNWLTTFTILTTDSSKRLQWLHDRMPVLLPTEDLEAAWLADEAPDAKGLMKICAPYNGEDLVWHPVTPSMSKTSLQGPECCKPLKRKSITTFFKPKSAPEGGISREAVKEDEVPAAPAGHAKIKAVSQSSTAQPTPEVAKKEDVAAEPDSSAGAVKQEDQARKPGASSSMSMSKKHAGTEVEKEQEEKQDEVGSSRVSGGSSQKTPTKKLKKTEGSMDSSPAAKRTQGPMDSFVIKNPA